MAGIVSFGTYVPFHRIVRKTIGAALGTAGGKGERAVAAYDEDAVTLAVEAARDCIRGHDGASIRSLTLATTDPPYIEKLNAATVHAALDLPPSVRALDIACSLRAGLGSMIGAYESAMASAPAGTALATMGDIRIGAPEGSAEQGGGDAGAAFLFGSSGVIAEVVATYSETMEFLSSWRLPGERFSKSWEERFSLTQGWGPLLASAAKNLLKTAGVAPADIAHVIVDAPNARASAAFIAQAGLKPEQVVDARLDTIGHAGAAQVGLMLATALENAKAGEWIAVFSASDGVDAMMLRVTDAIASRNAARTVDQWVASKRADLPYTRFLKWRGTLETEPPRRPDPQRPAGPPSLRSHRWKYALVGSECTACGTRHLPPQEVCVQCRASHQMREVGFSDGTAVIKTFAVDRLAFTPQPPMVVAVIDFEGGGRVQSELTDVEPEKVAIGDPLEMTFRRLFTADGIHNYFWKARPAR
ncbi:MAG TPA: OB-fold domain-containing protein [Candidatus Limnocylindrales bacterium]|nr:OB-fold domain-containing protein [Candidatus Limnocylindrales bacterium]